MMSVHRMQVLTCYTDSHIHLLERHYLPSLPPGCEVHLLHLPQDCPTGQYKSVGWAETVGKRLLAVKDMCDRGERFAVFDADMRFYSASIADGWPGPEDIIAQDEGPAGLCAGLMFIRPSPTVRELLVHAIALVESAGDDQIALNIALGRLGKEAVVTTARLPETYWNYGHQLRRCGQTCSLWRPGIVPNPPAGMLVHHANWVLGIEHKLAMLDEVRTCMSRRR
jgi:hypothetical protein